MGKKKNFTNPAILIALLVISGCAIQRSLTATQAKAELIGVSKSDILSCMGVPLRQHRSNDLEVWQYSSGDGSESTAGGAFVDPNTGLIISNSSRTSRACLVNVNFTGDHVSAVNYTGRTGGLLSKGEQCAYVVENCVK